MPTPYLHTGIDHFLERLPSRLLGDPDGWSLRFRDDALAELPVIGPTGLRLLTGMYRAAAAYAAAGNHAVVDDVIYDPRVLEAAVEALGYTSVLFVGIRCPPEVAEERERDRGDRALGGARVFADAVHRHGVYDLEVDSSILSPAESAAAIEAALASGAAGNAFARLRESLPSRT
jgi:chloramphenicol 3-O phosphotransferase